MLFFIVCYLYRKGFLYVFTVSIKRLCHYIIIYYVTVNYYVKNFPFKTYLMKYITLHNK